MFDVIVNIFQQVVSSRIWSALLVDFVILIYFNYVRRDRQGEIFQIFPFLLIVLFSRDAVSAFVRVDAILVVSDILILAAYLYWLQLFTGRTTVDLVVYGIMGLFAALVVTNLFVDFVSPTIVRLYRLLVLAFVGFLIQRLYGVTEFNTPNARLIITTRGTITLVFLIYNLVMLIFGRGTLFIEVFVIPIASALHLYMLSRYSLLLEEATRRQIAFLNESRESLFQFLQKVGHTINERSEVSGVLSYIVETAVASTDSDAGAILLVNDLEQTLTIRSIAGTFPPPYPIGDAVKRHLASMHEYLQNTPVKIGEGVLGEPAKTGQPIYIRDAATDERLKQNTKDDIQFISSIIVIPLVVSKKVLGVLSILKRKRGRFFEQSDLEKIQTFADYTSLTMDNLFTYLEVLDKREIEREVGIAAEIQQKLLPRRIPVIPNTSLSIFSKPARGVSGDYYDILKIKDGKVGLIICDVAGKGVPASLVMVMIRSILHLIASSAKDAASVVSWINRGISGNVELDHYATLSFLLYNPNTGSIEYSNAGHHPLLIYRKRKGDIEILDTPGIPIGIEPTTKYEQKTTVLESGDIILLYTDGIVEAMNQEGRQYGYESLVETVRRNVDLTPDEFSHLLQSEIQTFVGSARQHDDQTLLVLKVNPN